MITGSHDLTSPVQVDISRQLAKEVSAGGLDTRAILLNIGLSPEKIFKSDVTLEYLWLDIVRAMYAGKSNHGYRADAVAKLIAVVSDELQGNVDLAQLAYRIGQGSPQPVSGSRSVFLSYTTVNRAEVDKLYDALRRAGPQLEIFQDHRSLQLGQKWLDALRDRAGTASLLVCWVTQDYLKSAFCNYEIGIADSHGSKIIPLLVEPSSLGTLPAYLSQSQGIRIGISPDIDSIAIKILTTLK